MEGHLLEGINQHRTDYVPLLMDPTWYMILSQFLFSLKNTDITSSLAINRTIEISEIVKKNPDIKNNNNIAIVGDDQMVKL